MEAGNAVGGTLLFWRRPIRKLAKIQYLTAPATSPALLDLIAQARAFMDAMLPDERELYFDAQRRQSVRAEMAMRCEDSTVTVNG